MGDRGGAPLLTPRTPLTSPLTPLSPRLMSEEAKLLNTRLLYLSMFTLTTSQLITTSQLKVNHVTRGLWRVSQIKSIASLQQLVSGAAAIEFLLNPVFGALSDAHGRKAFLTLAALGTSVLRAAAALRPSRFNAAATRVVTGALIPAYMITANAALGDMYKHGSLVQLAWIETRIGLLLALSGVLCGAMRGWGPDEVGRFSSWGGVLATGTGTLTGWVLSRLGARRTTHLCTAVAAVSCPTPYIWCV
eukprot:gene12958-42144_t